MIKKLLKSVLPKSQLVFYSYYREQIHNFIILAKEYGQFNTIKSGNSFDKNHELLPWYTYPAIEYLQQLDFRDKTIFEYGCGNSSLFWAERAAKVISVDDDDRWYNEVLKNKKGNQELILAKDKNEYICSINIFDLKYNVIIIDGNYRYDCAVMAINNLENGGIIIFDNSDWFPKSIEYLRQQNLIQVDFSGFGPAIGFTWSTSIFFDRKFDINYLVEHQQVHPIGGLEHHAEE
jgi:hypothetical protein